ncbi:MAG: glycosyltransferase family A protein [Parasphingorhabdus sp.]|uniref:glycosyltransferase family 2 protein n=1 Tax=Parasphingorhabdus sp. TaxID=2709688 RepID=UPI003262D8A9
MTNPSITVVMPVYNVEKYIVAAIDSVLAQTFTDFEIVIIDDGGTDRSIEICESYTDPRIRIISQKNRGLAGARNTGILQSRGEYIAFLDSDDIWEPEKLALHKIHLDSNPRIGISYSGSQFIDEQGAQLRQAQRPKLENITAKDILTRNPIGNGSAPVIRKSALEVIAFGHHEEPQRICFFDESFRQSEDIELWIRLALTGRFAFEGIDGLLTRYRIVTGGLSANIAAQYESWNRVIQKTSGYAPEFIAQYRDEARAYQLRYLARRAVQMGEGAFALSLLKESLAISYAPLLKEPVKSCTTLVAAVMMRYLPANIVEKLAMRWTGGKVAA